MREMFIDLARVHFTAFAYELKQELCLLPVCRGPGLIVSGRDGGIRARMHQRPYRARHEAIGDEVVLLDVELRVAAFEVAGTVVLYAMAEYQVLRARGRADRIGLHKAQLVEGAVESGGLEEAVGDGKAPQVVEGDQHDLMLFKVLDICRGVPPWAPPVAQQGAPTEVRPYNLSSTS